MKRVPHRSVRATRGFTLVELLLVLVILGILAAIIVPKFAGRTEQANIAAAKTQIASISTALRMFEIDNGRYPGGGDGLQQLLVAPNDATNWKGPYLEGDIPLDPWRRPYLYEYPSSANPTGYDLRSTGADGQPGTEDDITNARVTAR